MLAEKETRGAVYNLAHFQVRVVPADVHYVLRCSQSADPCAHGYFNPLLQRLLITVDVCAADPPKSHPYMHCQYISGVLPEPLSYQKFHFLQSLWWV